MGFLDDLRDAFSKQATKPKANKTQGEKVLGNTIKLIGSLNGKTKVVEKTSYDPKIEHVSWINKATQKPTESAKYGRPMCLKIATNNSHGSMCSAVAVLSCKDWIDEERAFEFPSTMWSDAKVSFFRTLEITPKVEWLKDKDVAESEIKTKIHLVFLNPFDATRFFLDYAEENVKAVKLAGLIKEGKKVVSMSDMDAKPIKLSKIVIVIDPGHGYNKEEKINGKSVGNIGSGPYKFEYKSSDETIKTTTTVRADKVPQYVVDNPSKYIVTKKEGKVQSVGDNSAQSAHLIERIVVFKVSQFLKVELDSMGYAVWLTRDKETLDGYEGPRTRKLRIDVSNNKHADYFISVHYDGNETNITWNGAHIQYDKTLDKKGQEVLLEKNKLLGEAILNSYCPKMNINRGSAYLSSNAITGTGTQVIGTANKAPHKVLIELGYVTHPSDAKKLFDPDQYPIMAKGIAEGFKNHIEDNK